MAKNNDGYWLLSNFTSTVPLISISGTYTPSTQCEFFRDPHHSVKAKTECRLTPPPVRYFLEQPLAGIGRRFGREEGGILHASLGEYGKHFTASIVLDSSGCNMVLCVKRKRFHSIVDSQGASERGVSAFRL